MFRQLLLAWVTFGLSYCSLGAADLEVHFVDVDQGDCTLVKCPDGPRVLVDCGSLGGGDPARVREYLLNQLGGSPAIDVLVITHPDSDHYSLLPTVLDGIAVGKILLTDPDAAYSKANVDDWLAAFEGEKIILDKDHFDSPDAPSELFGSDKVNFYVLAANIEGTLSPTNTKSIVLMLSHGDIDVLLTGDATRDTEEVILERYEEEWLDVEVLKIGHHGSEATSTSPAWTAATSPEVATVSCGFENGFAHPRQEVIERLVPFTMDLTTGHKFRWGFNPPGPAKVAFTDFDSFHDAIYSTACNGDVVIRSNGTNFTVEHEGQTEPFGEERILAHAAAAPREAVAAPAVDTDLSFRVISWNLESGESDIDLLAEQMGARRGVHLWGLCEVPSSGAIEKLELGAEEGESTEFDNIFGNTGGDDRLAILYDTNRFELVGEAEELSFIQQSSGLRAPLVARLKGKRSGKEFLFMVNHLKRGGAQNPTRIKQAKLLNAWARDQELPVIAVGDYNFDYDVDLGDAGFPHRDQGFDELTKDGVFVYLHPDSLLKTNADDGFNSVLDFVFAAHAPFGWSAQSRILEREGDSVATENDFDDDQDQSDHRPVDALFTLQTVAPTSARTAATVEAAGDLSREEVLHRIEALERELESLRARLR